ncbi:PaaI family thioesterase [Turneriella parva]|jgi:acyl-coenzyme A thioesterase PaaI-like protein|uniref:Acyl-coenzyme A thioesterase THEM4 n=1 Tax=Turneriella parva (strain ATCC BAA-1111 / DSM 21527 / NCTC 11395 / H) TaxID=869212 RepID=I4B9H9_TURPD|nr:PaaI family thioesterase [Turneriella parva]AFM13936.1 thioesterase superfamily protein [Turneriella parva DSM 21527]MCB1202325.1 PaaI family thioesterase [Leptospiraceae bacterium]
MKTLFDIQDISACIAESTHIPDAISRFMSHSTDLIESRQYFHEATGMLLMEMRMGDNAEGPPDHVHGGFTSAILDEAMGGAAWCNGYPVLAANINVSLRKSIPLNQTFYCAGKTERIDTRRIYTVGQIFDAEGKLYTSATAVFIRIPEALLIQSHQRFSKFASFNKMRQNGHSVSQILEAGKA